MDPVFFEKPEELREWLERNHETATELWIGYHRKATGLPSLTWSETVDEVLCFGWIDGKRVGIDETSYAQRLTPRRPGSTWSLVNVGKVAELRAQGRMRPAGEAAFARRTEARSGTYSHENRASAELSPEMERTFRAEAAAWEFFCAQPAGYRKTAIWWVVSAKREETRERRLAALITDSAARRRLKQFTRPG